MNLVYLAVLSIVLLLMISVSRVGAQDTFKGIVPFVTTRAEVEKIMVGVKKRSCMNRTRSKIFFLLAAVVSGFVYSSVYLWEVFPTGSIVAQNKPDEAKLIRKVVIDYCSAAKAKEHDRITSLITRTPAYYWNRSPAVLPDIKASNPDGEGESNRSMETVPEDNSDFAKIFYEELTQVKPLVWKRLIVPEEDQLDWRVNGDYAIVRAKLTSENSISAWEDFLLVKHAGVWRIFRVTLSYDSQTFPYENRPAFAIPLPRS